MLFSRIVVRPDKVHYRDLVSSNPSNPSVVFNLCGLWFDYQSGVHVPAHILHVIGVTNPIIKVYIILFNPGPINNDQ